MELNSPIVNYSLPLICEYLIQLWLTYEGNRDHAYMDGRNVGTEGKFEGKDFRGHSSTIDNDEVAITSGARNEYSAPPDSFVQEVLLL